MNILRVFVPRLVAAGPLASGMAVQVVTTSSVMGLYDGSQGLSPYNASKMACTSVCEMVYHELQTVGEPAAHVQTHSLHPVRSYGHVQTHHPPTTTRFLP